MRPQPGSRAETAWACSDAPHSRAAARAGDTLLANQFIREQLQRWIAAYDGAMRDGDAKALLADSLKEEQFYGDAFTKPVFSRPDVHDVQPTDFLAIALPVLFLAALGR